MQLQSITIGQIFEWGKNLSITVALLTFVWKARGVWDKVQAFIDRFEKHMGTMEAGMNTLLTNHLEHLPQDIAKAISEKSHYAEVPENERSR